MVKKYLNIITYFIFLFMEKLVKTFLTIIGIKMLYKVPYIKSRMARGNSNFSSFERLTKKDFNSAYDYGNAFGIMVMLNILFFASINNFMNASFSIHISFSVFYCFFISFLSLMTNYILIFRKDQYKKYFKIAMRMEKREKVKWIIIAVIHVIVIIFLFMFSIFLIN